VKPSSLISVLETAITDKYPVLIKGAPGVGKTDLVTQACVNVNADIIISHPVVEDPVESKGFPMLDVKNNQATFVPFSDLVKLIDAKHPLVCFIDDLGQAAPMVQASKMQQILLRRINDFKISDQVTFIAATNRRTDKAAVSGILEPVKSRFVSILELDPDVDDWLTWAVNNPEIPMELVIFIKNRPEMLFRHEPTADITNSPSPRTVHNVGKWLTASRPVPQHLLYEVIAGAAGEAFAVEFTGFLKLINKMPDPDYALMNPDKITFPIDENDRSLDSAFAIAVAYRASDQNTDRFVKLINKFAPEFGLLSMKTAINRVPDIQHTKAYQKWAIDNHDLLS
jgi:hypothetical protein